MSAIGHSIKMGIFVAWRNAKIFRRDFLANISPTIADPLLFVVVFGYWLGPQVASYSGKTYLMFMAPGIAAMAALFSAFFEGSYGFYVRLELEGAFKAMMTTPVGPIEILMGELFWLASKGAVMATVVSLVLISVGVVKADYVFLIPLVGILTGISCGAIGLLASCYVRNINQFQSVYAWIISPMFFMSGMFVPTELMPLIVQRLCWISPFFHGVKLAQASLWSENVFECWLRHGLALLAISTVLVFWASKKILPKLQR